MVRSAEFSCPSSWRLAFRLYCYLFDSYTVFYTISLFTFKKKVYKMSASASSGELWRFGFEDRMMI